MAKRYWPFDSGPGGAVTESQWARMARLWRGTGVIRGELNEFVVGAPGSGVVVDVQTGRAWVEGHFFESDAVESLALADPDTTNPRIDRIVIRLDWLANTIDFAVKTGVPATNPVPPALTQVFLQTWELPLAQVYVPAQATVITQSNITDERAYANIPTHAHDRADAGGFLADGIIVTSKLADSAITTAKIADLNVTTSKLADSAITTAKIADLNVTTSKLADSAITTAKIADLNVTTGKLADSAVTTAKIADGAVTAAKLAGRGYLAVFWSHGTNGRPQSIPADTWTQLTGFDDVVRALNASYNAATATVTLSVTGWWLCTMMLEFTQPTSTQVLSATWGTSDSIYGYYMGDIALVPGQGRAMYSRAFYIVADGTQNVMTLWCVTGFATDIQTRGAFGGDASWFVWVYLGG